MLLLLLLLLALLLLPPALLSSTSCAQHTWEHLQPGRVQEHHSAAVPVADKQRWPSNAPNVSFAGCVHCNEDGSSTLTCWCIMQLDASIIEWA
jgi:hypothetical protein